MKYLICFVLGELVGAFIICLVIGGKNEEKR